MKSDISFLEREITRTKENGNTYVRLSIGEAESLRFSVLELQQFKEWAEAQLEADKALEEQIQQLQRELTEQGKPVMHMYCWSVQGSWFAVAQAKSVAEARKRLLEDCEGSPDGSCPERQRAYECIRDEAPTIWYSVNAEFALTDSAELTEQVA